MRTGAGRPPGATNALPMGTVEAIRAMRYRVPDGAPPELAALASHALARLADVLDERVHYSAAGTVMKAATILREEICGPQATKLEHSGADGAPLVVEIRKYGENDERDADPAGVN